jgi:hypothetical protein
MTHTTTPSPAPAPLQHRPFNTALKRRAIFVPGARHTTSEAVYLPVSKVFSCPKFKVLDVGNVYPQGRRHRFGDVSKPHVHPVDLDSQRMVSEFPEGIKTMTTHAPTPSTASPSNTPATTPEITRQQAIENALSTALYFIRQPYSTTALQAATGRAMRAASMLKQACTESSINGRV